MTWEDNLNHLCFETEIWIKKKNTTWSVTVWKLRVHVQRSQAEQSRCDDDLSSSQEMCLIQTSADVIQPYFPKQGRKCWSKTYLVYKIIRPPLIFTFKTYCTFHFHLLQILFWNYLLKWLYPPLVYSTGMGNNRVCLFAFNHCIVSI